MQICAIRVIIALLRKGKVAGLSLTPVAPVSSVFLELRAALSVSAGIRAVNPESSSLNKLATPLPVHPISYKGNWWNGSFSILRAEFCLLTDFS